MQTNRIGWLIVVFGFLLGIVHGEEKQAATVAIYGGQQASSKVRVTLLGITKGVAFLESQELAADGGRKHGDNVIPWLRVAVLAEGISDHPRRLGPIGIKIQTADGQEIVESLKVQRLVNGELAPIDGRASGVAQVALDFSPAAQMLFPTAPPRVEKPEQSVLLFFTMSGRVREARKAELILRFGNEEIVFKGVPVP